MVTLKADLLEIRKQILEDGDFLSAWDGMIETKSIEYDSLKEICATFYFFGYKACMVNSYGEENE